MSNFIDNTKIYFLENDLGLKHTGIEGSALLRAQLFHRQLGFTVTILTRLYRSHLATEVSIFKQRKRLPESAVVLSIYDYLQQFIGYVAPDIFIGLAREKVPFKSTENIKYLDDKGRLQAFAIYSQLNNRLHYINYFDNGLKLRRDYYHESGHLSCTQILSLTIKGKIEQEVFYQQNRKICLVKQHFYNDADKRVSTKYQTFDEEGRFSGFLSSEEDFISYCLEQYFNQERRNIYEPDNYLDNKIKYLFIVDKNKYFYSPSIKLKSKLGIDRVSVLPTLHNKHIINYEEKKTNSINSNYADVFKDLTVFDALIVQTNIQRQKILDEFDNPDNVYAIPHPYSMPNTNQADLERMPLKAVYFARYATDKKHELAIEAFSKVVEKIPKAEFHCYGIGDRLTALKSLVKDLSMTHNIFLHNWCDNVADEYESATLSIISSPSESFCLSLAESLAHGCPVVAFDVPYGQQELVQSDENGYLVPYGDIQSMANKVIQIMQDSTLQKRLSDNARKSAERYSEKTVGEKWLQLFQKILQH